MSAPGGFLGASWNDDALAVAARLGQTSGAWEPWEGAPGFEALFDIDHPVEAFGTRAYLRLFRSGKRLQGLTLRFIHCEAVERRLLSAIRLEFNLPAEDGPLYTVFDNGSVLHFARDSGDDTCQLTVAGPVFGKAFADYQLQRGFEGFSLGPR